MATNGWNGEIGITASRLAAVHLSRKFATSYSDSRFVEVVLRSHRSERCYTDTHLPCRNVRDVVDREDGLTIRMKRITDVWVSNILLSNTALAEFEYHLGRIQVAVHTDPTAMWIRTFASRGVPRPLLVNAPLYGAGMASSFGEIIDAYGP